MTNDNKSCCQIEIFYSFGRRHLDGFCVFYGLPCILQIYMKLNVIDSCIRDEYPKAYEDITAGEFLDERLVELGLLKK